LEWEGFWNGVGAEAHSVCVFCSSKPATREKKQYTRGVLVETIESSFVADAVEVLIRKVVNY
jgi:hypothetical protein